MKAPICTIFLAFLCLLSAAFAQERHNSLAVNEEIQDDAGPYYFIDYGDSSNAYAKAVPLARAMGIDVEYDNEVDQLVFSGRGITATLDATSNVVEGLTKRSGVLTANGEDIPSPMGIVVDGTSYVAITPLVKEAFNADIGWHSQYRLITINMPAGDDRTSADAGSSAPGAGSSSAHNTSTSANTATASANGPVLPPFRVGVHDDFTRVAVDMGSVSQYSIAASGNTMVVTFGAQAATSTREDRPGSNVSEVYYASSGGRPALVVESRHALDPNGRGYRVGRTASNTLYIDFAPGLEGVKVTQLASDWKPDEPVRAHVSETVTVPAVAPATDARPVVVLDAGHGGKFAGTHNGSWQEEEIVLKVVLMAREILESKGIRVVLTRDGDHHLSEDYRSDLSARAAFATPERNLFVSVHANAVDDPRPAGIETWIFGEPLQQHLIDRAIEENGGENRELGIELTNESIAFANETSGLILRETQLNYSRRLAHAVQRHLVQSTGAVDRGVRQNVFYVIKNARTPAILVELGFLSNPTEGRKLASSEYQRVLAQALVDGIVEFLSAGGALAIR